MKIKLIGLIAIAALWACSNKPSGDSTNAKPTPSASKAASSPTAASTPVIPKDGDYDGKGIVTKLNLEQGSIELDHEEIKDMMPAMQMEFFFADKKILDGLKVGDKVKFVLRYKNPTETIVSIKNAQ